MICINSPHDIFTRVPHYFQLNLDETSFLCYEGYREVFGSKDNPAMEKMQKPKVFNNSPLGWECRMSEWSSDISGKGGKGAP